MWSSNNFEWHCYIGSTPPHIHTIVHLWQLSGHEHCVVWNKWRFQYFFTHFFTLTWNKTSKSALLSLSQGNLPVTNGFPWERVRRETVPFNDVIILDLVVSQWTSRVIITSMSHKNDVAKYFSHNNDVIIASYVPWDVDGLMQKKHDVKVKVVERREFRVNVTIRERFLCGSYSNDEIVQIHSRVRNQESFIRS